MSNFDNSQISEEDKKAFAEMDHFDALKAKVIKEMGATFDDVTYETFTCMAQNGTVGALWTAAESCFKQAKLALGDWHYFIEDFEVQDDGSLQLVTGS